MSCFRALMLTALLCASGQTAIANDETLNEIIRLSNENVDRWRQAGEGKPPVAENVRKKSVKPSRFVPEQEPQEASQEDYAPESKTYYFASLSLPSGYIKNLLETLGKDEVVVFRGPLPNENLVDLYRRISDLLGTTGDAKKDEAIAGKVSLEIDPTKFRECNIAMVPATCVIGENGEKISAHGIFSGEYLKKQRKSIERAVGQTWGIAEIDLEEEIKKRILGLTEEDFRKEAIKSVFINREYVKLPRAKENRAFKFDPSVIRTEPIVIGGRQIAAANQKFNPVEGGLDYSYVVFDATDKDQIAAAQRVSARLMRDGKRVSLMVTDLPEKSNGFETIEKLTNFFSLRVTIIDKILAEKFRLLAVPAVVESIEPGMILVNEVKP